MSANLYRRNELGLLDGVNYKFNPDNSVDWRALVSEEHLFPNKGYFELRKLPVPTDIEGLSDDQILIKLSGIKTVAKIRGFNSVKFTVEKAEKDYCVVRCAIDWIKNFEHPDGLHYEEVANATVNNTSGFGEKFLETIGCNRSYVRAVRNSLNIFIVGSDEIDSSKNKAMAAPEEQEAALPSPQSALKKALKEIGVNSVETFRAYLSQLAKDKVRDFPNYENWNSSDDVPVKESRIIIALTKEHKLKK
jgi:hypothetical protein